MRTKTVRIFKEDYDLLKVESEYFHLPMGLVLNLRLAWYENHPVVFRRLMKELERTPGEVAVSAGKLARPGRETCQAPA